MKRCCMDGAFKKHHRKIILFLAFIAFGVCVSTSAADQTKIAIFNFTIQDIEASSYASTVTNQLINALEAYSSLAIMDRKELEHFLFLNEFQQNDNPQNIFSIGNRLGLEVIVAGKVAKQNSTIRIDCRVFKIDQPSEILHKTLNLLGDAKLAVELKELAALINQTIISSKVSANIPVTPKETAIKETCQLSARPGRARITLSWQVPPSFQATGYKVYRSASASGPFIKICETTERQYQDTDVEAKGVYYYKVKAFDQKGTETEFSTPLQASSVPTPEPPIILKAESHVKSIAVFWTPSPMERPDAGKVESYHIYRSREEEGPYQKAGVAAAHEPVSAAGGKPALATFVFIDKTLEDGIIYHYRITAANKQNHESDFSKTICQATIAPLSTPEVEGDLIREVRLRWKPTEAAFAKGYAVYRSQQSHEGFQRIYKTGDVKSNSLADKTGLIDDSVYYYYITIFEDQDLETQPSPTVSAKTKGPPPCVSGLETRSGLVKKVELHWIPLPQEEIAGYKIYRASNEAGPYHLIATLKERNTSRYTDAGNFSQPLEDHATYYYRLSTFNPVEVESKTFAAATAKTKPRPQKPRALQGVNFQVQKIPLNWQANPEEDIVHYHVFRKETGSGSFSNVGKTGLETAFTDSGLKNGTEYIYQLKAEDREGLFSDFSDPITVSTKARPRPPQGFNVHYENKEAVLRWQPNPEPDIVSYHIYERILILTTKITSVHNAEHRIAGLGSGKNKTLLVTAMDKDGLESEYSSTIVITGP